ncbi:MAG: YebC/PmpR family DNA-binding transcriptional regulator [Defluviitaleaceae bacterium]|nr:YebC/PmpR family DNA-binding transcriptional regulator [Defluviitaleaceae bacterium]
MAGHSKFANIRHKKERSDSKRSKIFTKIGREISVAVKQGGPNLDTNSRLRDAVAKAKANNMPNDNIERGIKKAAGEINDVNYESITYEGYGPNGIAVLVETLTDNRNRTAANVRAAFTKGGGNMGQVGSVDFLFKKIGHIAIEKSEKMEEDELMMFAIESGAEDFITQKEGFEIITSPSLFEKVLEKLKDKYNILYAEITMQPLTYVSLENPDDIKKWGKMLDLLEDDDDVQNVYHNYEQGN